MKYLLFFWISHVNTGQAAKLPNKPRSTTTISLHTNRHWLIYFSKWWCFQQLKFHLSSNSCIATCHSLQLPQARTAQVKEMLSQRSFWWTISLSKAKASSQCLGIGDYWCQGAPWWRTNEYLEKRHPCCQKDVTCCWNPKTSKLKTISTLFEQ